MKLSWFFSALLGSVMSCTLLGGQELPSASTPPAAPQGLYPEQGYLSSTHYANRYFGFVFDLPPDVQLEPVAQPAAGDGRIQILQLGGPPPAYAAVSIFALPMRARTTTDAKLILRKALDQELLYGVEQLHGLSKTILAGHQFYFYETRRGGDQHMMLACNLDGYTVMARLGANNDKTVKELESSFQHIMFIAPTKLRDYTGTDAWEYEGPAISSHRLAQLEADPPANHIEPGWFTGNLYENQTLGFRYHIQPGWILETEGAVEPAIERSRKQDFEQPWMGVPERELLKVCKRTLFSEWAKRPGPGGQLSYDDFGEVTVSAVSRACFPGLRFPAVSTDRRSVEDFLLQLGLTHPVLRNMRDARAFTVGDSVVIYLHGTVSFPVPGDELSRRLSLAMAVTLRRGYLLTWFLAAPHDSELKELLAEKIAFDSESLTEEASATKLGGGEGSPTPAPVAGPAQVGKASSQVGAAEGSANATSGAIMAPPDIPTAAASGRPRLARPGETTPDPQVNGKPLPQQNH